MTKYRKTPQATGDLISDKVADNMQQNHSETIASERDKKIPKERYISREERQKVIGRISNKRIKNSQK